MGKPITTTSGGTYSLQVGGVNILDNPDRHQQMSAAARSVAQPEAASRLADIVLELASR